MERKTRAGGWFFLRAAALAAAILAAGGCSKAQARGGSGAPYGVGRETQALQGDIGFVPSGGADSGIAPASKVLKDDAFGGASSAVQASALPPANAKKGARKLIKTGTVNLESRDLGGTEARIASMVEGLGGYVASSSNAERYLRMTLRVPQAGFDAAMAGLKGTGRLISRSESVEDVTLQYVDIESRIATKKILKERYTEYLRRAAEIEALLSVERALNEVLSELDSMEASFKALRDQIDYATITVGVEPPSESLPATSRSFLGGLLAVWDGFLGFLHFAAYALASLVLFGLPSVLVLGFLYWLCFGKIGLLKKFFRMLSGKGRAP